MRVTQGSRAKVQIRSNELSMLKSSINKSQASISKISKTQGEHTKVQEKIYLSKDRHSNQNIKMSRFNENMYKKKGFAGTNKIKRNASSVLVSRKKQQMRNLNKNSETLDSNMKMDSKKFEQSKEILGKLVGFQPKIVIDIKPSLGSKQISLKKSRDYDSDLSASTPFQRNLELCGNSCSSDSDSEQLTPELLKDRQGHKTSYGDLKK